MALKEIKRPSGLPSFPINHAPAGGYLVPGGVTPIEQMVDGDGDLIVNTGDMIRSPQNELPYVWDEASNAWLPMFDSGGSGGGVSLGDQNTWTELQIFAGGAYVGGQADSDVAPEDVVLSGKGAFPAAATNLTGSNLVLGGGAGRSIFTVVDYANLYGGFVDVFLNERLPSAVIYRLTEGVQFSAQTSNAVTAANLAAAINAWCPGVYATAHSAVVALVKAPAITNMRAESGTVTITHANAAYGFGYLDGPWSLLQTLYLDGEVVLPWVPYTVAGNFKNIDAAGKSLVVLAATAAWQADGVVGAKTGKVLLLAFQDVNITIPNSAPFSLASTYTSSVGGFLQLIYDGTVWREMWRK